MLLYFISLLTSSFPFVHALRAMLAVTTSRRLSSSIVSMIVLTAPLLLLLLLIGSVDTASAVAVSPAEQTGEASTPSSLSSIDYAVNDFDHFLRAFGKSYPSREEYNYRKSIFEANLRTISEHNSEARRKKTDVDGSGKGNHILGVNYFADQLSDELPTGYIKRSSGVRVGNGNEKVENTALPFTVDPVETLPKEVDWRKKGITTCVKWQGHCGSCWAFASTAVLEAHVALKTGTLYELSPQQLVSCADNPLHCGGEGGCAGATAEIAFDHVRKHGIVTEWSFGYQSFNGTNHVCSLAEESKETGSSAASPLRRRLNDGNGNKTGLYEGAVARISGYVTLESNNYEQLMNAVAKLGPLVVSVACSSWHLYRGGVLSVPMNSTIATNLNHAVTLEGYGTDQETGEDFWLVRNSWG